MKVRVRRRLPDDPIKVKYSRKKPAGYRAVVFSQCVLGSYPTREEARAAAELFLTLQDEPRLCNLRDIDKVRREIGKGVL